MANYARKFNLNMEKYHKLTQIGRPRNSSHNYGNMKKYLKNQTSVLPKSTKTMKNNIY